MRRIGIPALLLALGCACGCATTGVIRGRLEPSSAPQGPRPGVKDGSLADAVVYVEELPRRARLPATAPAPARIVARRDAFLPRVLPVAAGTTVEFRNLDRVYHNAFSVSPAKRFDLGKYGPGETRTVTFDRPGIVSFFCDLHPSAAGFVAVLPTPVFVRPDATGAFVLPPLPRGTYTVRAWHPRFGERRCRVNLTRSGDVDVELRF